MVNNNTTKNKQIMSKNIKKQLAKRGLNVKEFAAIMGFKYTTAIDWINAKTYPRIDKIEAMAQYFGIDKSNLVEENDTSPSKQSYLLTTFKELTEENQDKVITYATDLHNEQLEIEDKQTYTLPVVTSSAVAANPTPLAYGDTDIQLESFERVPSGASLVLPISGDSMEPTIMDGSRIFVHEQPIVENGEIAVIDVDGEGATCKKLYYDYENGKVRLVSINKKYDDRILDASLIRVIGKVLL